MDDEDFQGDLALFEVLYGIFPTLANPVTGRFTATQSNKPHYLQSSYYLVGIICYMCGPTSYSLVTS